MKPLYILSDGGALRFRGELLPRLKILIKYGGDLISYLQIREQNLQMAKSLNLPLASDEEILEILAELKPLCEQNQIKLVLSRRLDLALTAGVQGLHLGRESNLAQCKLAALAGLEVGYSAHSPEEIKALSAQPIDYFFLSPIFKSISKQDIREPLGLEPLRVCRAQLSALEKTSEKRPPALFALGGINSSTAPECLSAGADGLALIGDLLFASDIRARLEQYRLSLASRVS